MRRKQPPLVIVIAALCLGMGTVHQAGAQATAPKVDQLGQVHFPVSCAGEVQAKFHRAMALYHSFAMAEGKVAFDEIASLDPRCGMAHWGLAMVAARNPFGWPVTLKLQEGAEAIQKAKEVGAATPRERDYIAALEMLYKDHATVPHRQRALAYEQAMEKLAAAYPDDVEVKILYALAVSANNDLNDKTFARPLKAAGLLEPLFAAYPQHPGVAHYLIHSYDYPPIAPKGLEVAKRYAQIAPDAAHAQHMPSHIFTRVGAWRESVDSNQTTLAAMRTAADHEDQTEKHIVTPGPIMPARELLGDLLMELGRPAEALPQYEASIAKEPNRFRGLYGAGLAAERAGDRTRAKLHFEKLVAIAAPSDGTRPELAHARQVVAQR
jgi:tetratricopeptide (TPR) repeat protein